eukprot:s2381_g2.t1
MGCEGAKVTTALTKERVDEVKDAEPLDDEEARRYRSVSMRLSYLAQDRPDLQVVLTYNNDFELFRACGPLYPAFAIESLTSLLLGLFFCYLSLKICVRSDVERPVSSFIRMLYAWAQPHISEWWEAVSSWPEMHKRPLHDRMGMCRQLNLAMCIAQALAAFLSIFRWLHIGNVNGVRYLGYAFTCSLMQAELVVLIAPYVPCYKVNCVGIVILTHIYLILGWIGSLHDGFLFEEPSWELFLANGQVNDLVVTTKGIFIGCTAAGLCSLLFIQMPFLALIYFCKGGSSNEDLPPHFLKLFATVWLTWPAFPAWWIISAEGLGLIGDSKSNAVGFAILNIISKGTFTFVMLGIGTQHKKRSERKQRASEVSSGKAESLESPSPSPSANPANWLVKSLQEFERSTSVVSEAERKEMAKVTGPVDEEAVKEAVPKKKEFEIAI